MKKFDANQCPVQRALEMVSGKWAFSILYALSDGKKRFKQLERSIVGINTRMLVKELKILEGHGIIERAAYATVPPTVEYSLTRKGQDLHPVLDHVRSWAARYLDSYACDPPEATAESSESAAASGQEAASGPVAGQWETDEL